MAKTMKITLPEGQDTHLGIVDRTILGMNFGEALKEGVPAGLGAAAGTAVLGPVWGPIVGAPAGYALDQAIKWGINRGYMAANEAPPFQMPTARQGAYNASLAAVAGMIPGAAAGAAEMSAIPGAFRQFNRFRSVTGGPIDTGYVPETSGGKMVLTPSQLRQRTQAELEGKLFGEPTAPSGPPETAPDLYGNVAAAGPEATAAKQAELYTGKRAASQRAVSGHYSQWDETLNHPANLEPKNTVMVGEEIRGTGENAVTVGRYNQADINTKFDYRAAADDLKEAKAIAQQARIPDSSKLMQLLNKLTDKDADWYAPLDTVYKDIAQIRKSGVGPEFGTRTASQRAMLNVVDRLEARADATLMEAAAKAGRPLESDAAVQAFKAQGAQAALERGKIYNPKLAKSAAARAQQGMTIAGTPRNVLELQSLQEQSGPLAMQQLARAHVRRSVQAATQKQRFDALAFDNALWKPGPDALHYTLPDTDSFVQTVGEPAVNNIRRKLFDAAVKDPSIWPKFHGRTVDLLANADPEMASALTDFFSAAAEGVKSKAVMTGPTEAKAALQSIGKLLINTYSTPGMGGQKQRIAFKLLMPFVRTAAVTIREAAGQAIPIAAYTSSRGLTPQYTQQPPEQQAAEGLSVPQPTLKVQFPKSTGKQ